MSQSASALPIEQRFEEAAAKLQKARTEIAKSVLGQPHVIDLTLTTLIAGGHGLLVGVPGLAKTLLVETAAIVLGLASARIQCTPDLMPADIIGSEILEEHEGGKRGFRFVKGPVFAELLMADEINRASPRTQSALLQAMQEKSVTVAGQPTPLPRPFHVLATQNPIEQEGTYPLPEAQLDRFLMQIDVQYPDAKAERDIILTTTGPAQHAPEKILDAAMLTDIQMLVREMPVGESVVDTVLAIVRGARPDTNAHKAVQDYVSWAPGPRAAQALLMAAKARALLEGRETPSAEDVQNLALPVLQHRMALNYKARADGVTLKNLLDSLSQEL